MKYIAWLCRTSWPLALGMTVLAAGAPAQDAPPHDAPPPARKPRDVVRFHDVRVRHGGPEAQFGMAVAPLPKPLEVQLKLKDKGVLVAHVRKGSAADKAGVQDNDIVLMVDDAPVKEPKDLIITVEEAPEKERTLKLLRAGETITVTVTPAKPTEEHEDEDVQRFQLEGDQLRINLGELRDLEKTIRDKLRNAGVDMRMHIIEPGAFLPRGADFSFGRRTSLPDDIAIVIRKQGKEPADIEVKKGEETWTVKEDDLEPLPEEVRAAVAGYLGHTPMKFRVVGPSGDEHGFTFGGPHPPGDVPRPPRRPEGPDGPPRGPGDAEHVPPQHGPEGPDGPQTRRGPRPERRGPDGPIGPPEGPGDERFGPDEHGRVGGGLERRLDEMARRMEDMQRQLEGLRHHLDDERGDRPDRPESPEEEETESDES